MLRKPNVARLARRKDVDGLVRALAWPKHDTVRQQAARALGEVGDARAIGPLLTAAEQDVHAVAAVAVAALDDLDKRGHRVGVDQMVDALARRDVLAVLRRHPQSEQNRRPQSGKETPETAESLDDRLRTFLERRAGASDVDLLLRPVIEGSGPFSLRTAAIAALAVVGDPAVVPPLAERLTEIARECIPPPTYTSDDEFLDRARSYVPPWRRPQPLARPLFFALASFPDPVALRALAEWLRHTHEPAEDEIATFCALDHPLVDDLLTDLAFARSDPTTLRLLADGLEARARRTAQEPSSDLRALLAILREDVPAAVAIGRDGLDGLLRALDHPAPPVKWRALEALRELPDPRAIDALVALVNHENFGVSRHAKEALVRIDHPRVADHLLEVVARPESTIAWATEELARRGDRRAVGVLRDRLRRHPPGTGSREARREAVQGLGVLGGDEAVDVLLGLLADPHPEEALTTVVRALGQTRSTRAVEPLLRALDDRILGTRDHFQIVGALGEIGDRRAVPALCEALSDTSWYGHVQSSAAIALMKIGDPSALPALRAVYLPDRADAPRTDDDEWNGLVEAQQSIRAAIHVLEKVDRRGEAGREADRGEQADD